MQHQEGSIFSLNVVKRAPILLLTRALEKVNGPFSLIRHLTEEERFLADRYYKRMTFKVCGADDAVARGKTNLLGKRSKKTTSHVVKSRVPAKEHEAGGSHLPADGVVAASPLRGDNELSIEESMINLSISSNISAYSDPASIEGHVEALLHLRDEERLRGIGVAGRANYGVSTIYQVCLERICM